MTITKHLVLKPQYYNSFSCINSSCEDNCCNKPWRIHIDKKTYEMYENVEDTALRQKLDFCIKRINSDNASESQYAEFVFEDGGQCPFQTGEGLCEIHRDLGERFLCRICRMYPRSARSINDEYIELSVSMSCPEAVRVALYDVNPMEFDADEVEIESDNPLVLSKQVPLPGDIPTHYIKYGWDMRAASIAIMQDRLYPISHRLAIISMMLEQVVLLHDNQNASGIPFVLQLYCEKTVCTQVSDSLKSIKANDNIRREMCTMLYHTIKHRSESAPGSVFAEIIARIDSRIESTYPISINQYSDNGFDAFYAYIEQAVEMHWDSFLSQWSHVLENYFVNYMFSEIFPLKHHDANMNPYHHSLILAIQLAFLRILLCGNYNSDEGFNAQYITRTITHVAEIVQHTAALMRIAFSYVSAKIAGLEYVFFLL